MTSKAGRRAVATTSPDGREEVSSSTAAKISGVSRSIHDSSLSETELSQEEVTSDSTSFIRSSEVRPGDVLCCKGNFDTPGNARFRALVKPRKDEYVKAKKGEPKTKIAQEIIDEFYSQDSCIDAVPRGRFLQPVEKDVWQELDNYAILDKVKMALRQKPKSRLKMKKAMNKIGGSAATDTPVETVSAPKAISAEQHTSQLDSVDIFSPIDIETIDTELGDEAEHYSSSTDNLSPEASSPANLERNIIHRGDIFEDLRQIFVEGVEGRYSPVVAPQQADQCQDDTINSADIDTEIILENSSILSNIQVSPLFEPAGSTMGSTENPSEFLLPEASSSNSNIISQRTTSGVRGPEERTDQQGIWQNLLLESSVSYALQLCRAVRATHDAAESLAHVNVQEDLHALGRTLYQHFSGRPFSYEDISSSVTESDNVASEHGESERSTKRRGSQSTGNKSSGDLAYIAVSPVLKDLGFPVSLSILVASLLDANCHSAPDRYCSVAEVEEDLVRMVTNPDRYLLDLSALSSGTQLVFPRDKLYGRERECEILMKMFDHVISTTAEKHGLLLIAGKSGAGKTALVDNLRAPLAERRGVFVSCKFDPQRHEQPMSVIFRAFDEYCKSLWEGDQAIRADVAYALRQALGPNAVVLKELVPHLGPIVGGWESTSDTIQPVDRKMFNRTMFYFRAFVRTIAGPTHPVMVLFDDLQYADKATIDLITALVMDTESSSLLFVGCYRANEVNADHPLTDFFGAVARAAVPMSTVSLSNLDKDSINEFVCDTLHLSPRLTRALSDCLHTKTGGNPLFVVELFKSLCGDGLVHFSASSRRWKWNIEAIWEKDIPDIAVDLVLDRMRNYGPEVQWVLRIASCIGLRFDREIMRVLCRDDCGGEIPIARHLEKLVADGILVLVDSTYKFTHDQIWQAAYSLTPVAQREEMHLNVGRQLLARLESSDDMGRMLFTVVDQLNRGSSLVTDHDEKLRVAELNLMAGGKASSASLFLQASVYLLEGTVLLEDRDWESHYDLCLELFTSCAEAQAATGTPGALLALQPVFRHARCLEDSFRANIAVMTTLGNEDKALDALKHGLDCAAQVGEMFPESIDLSAIVREIGKTQAMIQKESVASILQMELMTDEVKLYVMTLLERLVLFAYWPRRELVPMLSCRMIQISLSHGLCPRLASAFAVLGCTMCTSPQGVEQAYEYGKLALALVDRMNDKSLAHHVELPVYGLIHALKDPFQACIEKCKETFNPFISAGDLMNSRACAATYLLAGLQSGCHLESFIMLGRSYMQQLRSYGQKFMDSICAVYLQVAMNLTGPCDDPSYLSVEMLEEEGASINVGGNPSVILFRVMLAYLFGQYELAANMMEEQRNAREGRTMRNLIVVNESFYSGLVALAMAREKRDGPWKEVAKEELEKLRTWSVLSSWNYQHKDELLTAEIAWLDGDSETARRFYDASIESAECHQFIHEQALACERAGIFISETVSPAAAKAYFSRAHRCYVEWGAKIKAEDIMTRYLS